MTNQFNFCQVYFENTSYANPIFTNLAFFHVVLIEMSKYVPVCLSKDY